MSKKHNLTEKITVRMSKKAFGWFVGNATMRGLKLSVFVRDIPSIMDALNEQLDEKDDKIIELELQNTTMQHIINERCQ